MSEIDWGRVAAQVASNHENMEHIYRGLSPVEQSRLNDLRRLLDSEHEALEAARFDDEITALGISGQPATYRSTLQIPRARRSSK